MAVKWIGQALLKAGLSLPETYRLRAHDTPFQAHLGERTSGQTLATYSSIAEVVEDFRRRFDS
ncbi:hypothetical protein A3SI_01426 [Nitritalea halalkaliphila LW7]|uniref:Uncharacterized protein n=1 Tax=Nitritalea halalkaliphila LW7 TaxID=1189621 RepID=I5CA49_9BACT|nr:hypothetical protein [Nitritalea halalkaliphila]EIM78701.1 hypothetical protein A3SI_01426 [Nitritalea halalkaliphila LW7]